MSFTTSALLFLILAAGFYGLTYLATRFFFLRGGFHRPMRNFPEKFGLSYEKIRFPTTDGTSLAGWYIPAKTPTDRTLILCHGWGTNKGEILPGTHFLAERFNLFYFDFRRCGESDGTMSSIGYFESRDFDAALDWIKTQRPLSASHLGVYGFSLGAAVSFMGAARHPEIKAAVIEDPFFSFKQAVKMYCWYKWRLPYFPLLAMVVWHANHILGIDPESWTPLHHAEKIERTPVLFIHAEGDPVTPVSDIQSLHERIRSEKELWIVPYGAHEGLYEIAGDEYRRRISSFYDKHL